MKTTPDMNSIQAILSSRLDPEKYRFFLFGSRATQRGRENSDWDIGILGQHEVSPLLLARIKSDLDDLKTLHRFDVVDLWHASERFKKMALRDAVALAS